MKLRQYYLYCYMMLVTKDKYMDCLALFIVSGYKITSLCFIIKFMGSDFSFSIMLQK